MGRKSPESDELLLDLAWERQQKKVSNYCSVFAKSFATKVHKVTFINRG